MHSLTQKGNLGQMISFILTLIGMTQDQADAGAQALIVSIGVVLYVVSWVITWYARYRKGDLTVAGFRK